MHLYQSYIALTLAISHMAEIANAVLDTGDPAVIELHDQIFQLVTMHDNEQTLVATYHRQDQCFQLLGPKFFICGMTHDWADRESSAITELPTDVSSQPLWPITPGPLVLIH